MPLPRLVVLRDADRPPRLDEIARLADVREVSAPDLHEVLPGTEVLLAWDFRSPALAGAWEAADRLRWVHTASAGVDNVLTPAVAASGVTVTNSRGVFDAAIAEYVLGLVLMFAKDLGGTWERQRAREWQHRETEPVAGATAVVVGVGPIGRATAALLGAAGMRVRAVGRTARTGDPDLGEIVASSELAALLPDADYLVLAAPLTDQTRGMVDGAALAAMKP